MYTQGTEGIRVAGVSERVVMTGAIEGVFIAVVSEGIEVAAFSKETVIIKSSFIRM